jgi:hypothetical protein
LPWFADVRRRLALLLARLERPPPMWRVDVVRVWTGLAQRHHEAGYWFGFWAGNPEPGASELRKQRSVAAVGARRANEVVAERRKPQVRGAGHRSS